MTARCRVSFRHPVESLKECIDESPNFPRKTPPATAPSYASAPRQVAAVRNAGSDLCFATFARGQLFRWAFFFRCYGGATLALVGYSRRFATPRDLGLCDF